MKKPLFILICALAATGCATNKCAKRVTHLEDPGPPVVFTWTGTTTNQPPTGTGPHGDYVDVILCKDELVVTNRVENIGAVVLRKVVKEEPYSKTVRSKTDDWRIERIPAKEGTECMPPTIPGGPIYLCLTKEEPVIGTRRVVGETVRLHRVPKWEERTITGTLRSEHVEVIKLADCPTNTPPRLQ